MISETELAKAKAEMAQIRDKIVAPNTNADMTPRTPRDHRVSPSTLNQEDRAAHAEATSIGNRTAQNREGQAAQPINTSRQAFLDKAIAEMAQVRDKLIAPNANTDMTPRIPRDHRVSPSALNQADLAAQRERERAVVDSARARLAVKQAAATPVQPGPGEEHLVHRTSAEKARIVANRERNLVRMQDFSDQDLALNFSEPTIQSSRPQGTQQAGAAAVSRELPGLQQREREQTPPAVPPRRGRKP